MTSTPTDNLSSWNPLWASKRKILAAIILPGGYVFMNESGGSKPSLLRIPFRTAALARARVLEPISRHLETAIGGATDTRF